MFRRTWRTKKCPKRRGQPCTDLSTEWNPSPNRLHPSNKSCWSWHWSCARPAAKSNTLILKSRSRIWWIPSWMNWRSCRRWRHIIPSGMVCATRWRATTRTGSVSTIRSRSRKNFVPSRMPSFKKRSVCGSRWSKRRQRRNRTLRRMKNHLRRILLRTLLQIRRLQTKIFHQQLLILHGFHPNIF